MSDPNAPLPSHAKDSGRDSPWASRADEAARSVTRMFGHRVCFLPGTHLAAVQRPSGRLPSPAKPWHYWWQAHYLDCLVDTGRRELARKRPFDGDRRPSAGKLASRLVTGVRLRNLLTFVNSYYDDMAWLALAAQRLRKLAEETRRVRRRRNEKALRTLELQFDSATTSHLGGGTFWNTTRDFKNTPATAPVALFYARNGNTAKAQELLDWLAARLLDPAKGLYLDGLRIRPDGSEELVDAVYTYNQGPVLGALLELGGVQNLKRAAALIAAVDRELTQPAQTDTGRDLRVLRGEGTGDGGLFTGILARYLALAAADPQLPSASRTIATQLVTDSAISLWEGRRLIAAGEPLARYGGTMVFSLNPEIPAAVTYPPGAAVELSTQLQAWMILEAAATLQDAEFSPFLN
ncbi:glycoside hydrolase family 76 protein [Arthrobacter sp. SA17]